LGFRKVSMSTNGFLLNRQLLADLEGAGLDGLQISVDRMTPIASTRKAMKSIVHKLDWFKDSKIKPQVSGVLFKETLDEMGQVIDTCLDLGIPVHARGPRRSLARPRLARCKCERADAPLSRPPGETEAQRLEDSLELEPFRLPKEDAAAGTDRMDLHRGL